MNKAILKGNVGHTPEIKDFDNGKMARFSLATTERGYTKRDGTIVDDRTTWHNIVVRNSGLAGVVEKFVSKGTPVLIVGRIENRKYEGKDRQDKFITEIVADELELCGGQKKDNEAENDMPDNW